MQAVLKKLQAAKLYAKLLKGKFHQSKINYLGCHIIHKEIKMDPAKVQAPESNFRAS